MARPKNENNELIKPVDEKEETINDEKEEVKEVEPVDEKGKMPNRKEQLNLKISKTKQQEGEKILKEMNELFKSIVQTHRVIGKLQKKYKDKTFFIGESGKISFTVDGKLFEYEG